MNVKNLCDSQRLAQRSLRENGFNAESAEEDAEFAEMDAEKHHTVIFIAPLV